MHERHMRLTEKVLVIGREALSVTEVVKVTLDISAEVSALLGCNKAEDLHGTVVANPEIPLQALNSNVTNRLANGVNIADPSQPVLLRLR